MFKNLFDGPIVRQYAVVIIVNLSLLGCGLGLAWTSPVLVKLRDENDLVLNRPITEEEGSWIVSIGFLTGIICNFLPALLTDRIGRKYCILVGIIPKIITAIILTFATEVWMLLLGRALGGVADAFIFTVVPMYASEIASKFVETHGSGTNLIFIVITHLCQDSHTGPFSIEGRITSAWSNWFSLKEVRGSLGTILQIMCSLGIVVMLSVGPFISYLAVNILFTATVVVSSIPVFFLPDSPYFLYSKGRSDETLRVLTFLRGSEAAANLELKEYASEKKTEDINKIQLFKDRLFLKSFTLVTIILIGSQLIGFNAVSFYLQTVLESTQTSIQPEIASVIIGCIQLIASIVTTSVTDKFGRKTILSTTLIGMMMGMVGLGTFFYVAAGTKSVTGFMNFLPLISLILIVFCYSAGPGSLNWALSAELFDNSARGFGVSLSMTISMVSLFLTTRYFAPLMVAIGPAATYWTFGVNCLLLCLFIIFLVPETKGKSFSEIQEEMGAKINTSNEEIGIK